MYAIESGYDFCGEWQDVYAQGETIEQFLLEAVSLEFGRWRIEDHIDDIEWTRPLYEDELTHVREGIKKARQQVAKRRADEARRNLEFAENTLASMIDPNRPTEREIKMQTARVDSLRQTLAVLLKAEDSDDDE